MKKITKVLLTAVLLIVAAFAITACGDTEWDQAMKNAIKEFSPNNADANYSIDMYCAYGYGTQNERTNEDKILADGLKWKDNSSPDIKTGSFSFIQELHNNDAPYQMMLIGSMIGKGDYFTVEEGNKYILLDEKKAEIGARIGEIGSLDVVTEMYYVINDGRIMEYYAILDRSSGETHFPEPPMFFHLTFEYGNVSL